MKYSLMIEGQAGITWPRWRRLAQLAEQLGFFGLYRSDHFTNSNPPDMDSLEMVVSLTYLASHTQRIHFGPLVAPLSFRDPVMLARQAMAIDDLSGGRTILGVGAGWQEREHSLFGYPLADVETRFARLEEGLQVITQLIHNDQPVNFNGRFFKLSSAQLLPRPARPTPVLVGGNGPARTLPLVARYADIWNAVGIDSETFKQRNARLDEFLAANGRQPAQVRRTIMLPVMTWKTGADRQQRLEQLRRAVPVYASFSDEDILNRWHTNMAAITGLPDDVGIRLQAYQAAGVEEVMMQWLAVDDEAGLEALASLIG
jgi:F420-dependent oxidoreductase-like protein